MTIDKVTGTLQSIGSLMASDIAKATVMLFMIAETRSRLSSNHSIFGISRFGAKPGESGRVRPALSLMAFKAR